MSRYKLYVWVCLLLITSTGCTLPRFNTKSDMSFINADPCKAPCWHNINLQESSSSDVYSTLENLPFVIQETVKEWNSNYAWLDDANTTEIHYCCSYSADGVCGLIVLASDQVVVMTHWIAYKLTFIDVVTKLGEPQYWTCVQHMGGGQSGSIVLYWPDLGISAESSTRNCLPNNENPESDSQIDYISYSVSGYFLGEEDPINYPRWDGFVK